MNKIKNELIFREILVINIIIKEEKHTLSVDARKVLARAFIFWRNGTETQQWRIDTNWKNFLKGLVNISYMNNKISHTWNRLKMRWSIWYTYIYVIKFNASIYYICVTEFILMEVNVQLINYKTKSLKCEAI